MTDFRRIPVLLAAAVSTVGLFAVGCGSDSKPLAQKPATPSKADFPDLAGESYDQAASSLPSGAALAPSVTVLDRGTNRYGFAIFDSNRDQLSGAKVALYTTDAKGRKVRGPYPAHEESLAVDTRFRSKTSSSDPDAAKTLYVANVPFQRGGKQGIFAVVSNQGKEQITDPQSVLVERGLAPPSVGSKAVSVDTPTAADVAGDLAQIDTRQPPTTMHETSLKDALGKKPVVLLFATPQLCQSRVCGPVADIAEQLKATYGDRVDFIMQEIYRDNEPSKGFRPQVTAWKLPTEPWVFVIGKNGKVAGRIEGAFSVAELEREINRVLQQPASS